MTTSVQVTVPILYDTVSEAPEAFRVVLSNATGSLSIMSGSHTTNIRDNNPPPDPPSPWVPTITFSSTSEMMVEGETRQLHLIATVGITSYGSGAYSAPTCFIFLETIRDYSSQYGLDSATLEMRVVAHEVGHTLLGGHGNPGADEGIMGPDVMESGSDSDNVFTPRALRVIQSQLRPKSGS